MPDKRTADCPICGRPLPPKPTKRGPPKQYHRECLVFMSRLGELQQLLQIMRFKPPCRKPGSNAMCGHAKQIRSEIHHVWKLFTVKSVKCATDDTEYYTEWEAVKAAQRERERKARDQESAARKAKRAKAKRAS